MNVLKNIFLFNKKIENNKVLNNRVVDQYIEIAKLVKEARIQKNLTIKELSRRSKIPEQTISSIEDNNKNIRPNYPFKIILIKLEECLALKKFIVELAIKEKETLREKGFSCQKI